MEIGKKKRRKDGTVVDLWGEYGKRFTNGHKSFTSAQVKAVNELQAHEEKFREDFMRDREVFMRARDPMVGDETPRDAHGQPIMNSSQLKSHIVSNNAELLIPANRPPARSVPPIKNPPGPLDCLPTWGAQASFDVFNFHCKTNVFSAVSLFCTTKPGHICIILARTMNIKENQQALR